MVTRVVVAILALCSVICWADGKLLVRFRSADHCRAYVQQHSNAKAIWGQSKAPHLRQMAAPASALLPLVQTATVWTSNPDSIRRILSFDTTVVAVWVPRRYQLDRSASRPVERQHQWYLEALSATQAWHYTRGDSVFVGIIDTGIDWTHPDLETTLWVNRREDRNGNGRFEPWHYTEIRNGVEGDLDGNDDDGNGFIDDVIGYSFITRPTPDLFPMDNPIPLDRNGHGTAVASLIAARPATYGGMSGLAPGARVMVLQAFDPLGVGDEDDIARAILYAASNGARVINCSFGDIVRSDLVAAAIAYARERDIVIVASSGNSATSLPHYPSDEVGVLSVGASTENGKPALFSSFGERLFLLAPGEHILTAALNGGYQVSSGTSFAAPLVSATVALLRAFEPSLNAETIRTVLAESATPRTHAWQLRSGHGIVSPRDALERVRLGGIVRLTLPTHPATIPEEMSWLDVTLDVAHPLLERWQLFAIGRDSAFVVASSDRSVFGWYNRIERSRLPRDSAWTLRLRAQLRTGKTIDDAVTVESIHNQLKLTNLRTLLVWNGRERRILVLANTNRRCHVHLAVKKLPLDSTIYNQASPHIRRNHDILLPRLDPGRYNLTITAWDEADTVSAVLDSIQVPAEVGSNAEWKLAQLSAEPLLLSGSFSHRANQLCATRFGGEQHAAIFERIQDTFRIVARSQRTAFLRGAGDVNGDGFTEMLAYDAGDSWLYSIEPQPFASILWGDTTSHSFWAAGLADITGDGNVEILGFRTRRTVLRTNGEREPRSDALIALTWDGTAFSILDSIELSSPPQAGRTINTISAPLCATGDFDGDGVIEVAYADSDGDLEIAGFVGGRFVREFIAPSQPFLAGAGTEFVAAADVDGDGKMEILSGAAALPTYNELGEYEPPLWRFALYRATAENRYALAWQDYFYGVRLGRPYYNGVATGDLNGDGKAEIVLTLFPYAYVFSWSRGRAELIGVFDSVWSNGAIIVDLERNGIIQVGLTKSILQPRLRWFTYTQPRLRAPAMLDAHFQGDGTLLCKWLPLDSADRYQIRVAGIIVAELSNTMVMLSNRELPACDRCNFDVRAIRGVDTSRWSDPIVVVRAEPLTLEAADTLVAGERFIRLTCRGFLPADGIPPSALRIERADGEATRALYTTSVGTNRLFVWLEAPLEDGVYQVTLSEGTTDGVGNRSPASRVTMYVSQHSQETPMFYAERVVSVTDTTVSVRFSQEPDIASLVIDSIHLQPYGRITRCTVQDEHHTLTFAFDSRYRYEARGMTFTMTLPPSFRSKLGTLIARSGGNVIAWFYPAQVSRSEAFPQPLSRSRDRELRISNVPMGATVIISTLDGIELARIDGTDPSGGARWQLRLADGSLIPEGVYLYRIRLIDGTEAVLQKFVVVP